MRRLVWLVVGVTSDRIIAVMIYDTLSDRLPPTVAGKQRLSSCHQATKPDTSRVHAYHYT